MLLSGNGISMAYGNTLQLKISLKRESEFTDRDKVLVKIRDGNEEQLLSKVLNISDKAAYFLLNSEESRAIPPGDHQWDITVYINAQMDGERIVTADEIMTPFCNAAFKVTRQTSREGD